MESKKKQRTKPPVKRLFKERCMTPGEYPKILLNLDVISLELMKFIVDCPEEEIKSGVMRNYISKRLEIKRSNFQKKLKKLVDDKILEEGKKEGYYYVRKEVKVIYKKIFDEQKRLEIFELYPDVYHFICVFLVKIPKKNFNNENIHNLISVMEKKGFLLHDEGIEYTEDGKIEDISFFYDDLLFNYYLMVGLEFDSEYKQNYYYVLKSDIHITKQHKFFIENVSLFTSNSKKKEKRLYKKWVNSLCFSHLFDTFWYLTLIMNASLLKIHTYGPNEIKIEEVKNEKK